MTYNSIENTTSQLRPHHTARENVAYSRRSASETYPPPDATSPLEDLERPEDIEDSIPDAIHRVDNAEGDRPADSSDHKSPDAQNAPSSEYVATPVVRVALFHPMELVSVGLLHAWGKLDSIEITSHSNDPTELARALIRTPADIAITSLEHCEDGLEILEALRFTFPELPVLLLCQDESIKTSNRWIEAGAAGYVSQNATLDQVTTIVRWVAGGRLVSNLSNDRAGGAPSANAPIRSAFVAPPKEHLGAKTMGRAVPASKGRESLCSLASPSVVQQKSKLGSKPAQSRDNETSHWPLKIDLAASTAPTRDSHRNSNDVNRRIPALSSREREVLDGLALGMTNQQIADSLFLSVKTVETYRSRLRQKLQVDDRAGMVRYARQLSENFAT